MNITLQHACEPATPSWEGQLALDFANRQGTTILAQHRHKGPLRVLRPFYPEGRALCHLAIIHPPGGLVGGDSLHLEATAAEHSGVLLTTPAASKVYRSAGIMARQHTVLHMATGASLEWLPQEQILYDGAQLRQYTHIRLAKDSLFMGWELTVLGRPGCGEDFRHGSWENTLQVDLERQVIFLDIMRLAGGSPALQAAWGLRGCRVVGTCLASDPDNVLLETWRAGLDAPQADHHWAATRIHQLVVLRYLGTNLRHARSFFAQAWRLARPLMLGRPPCIPRLWAT
jgi:urease accessory protein